MATTKTFAPTLDMPAVKAQDIELTNVSDIRHKYQLIELLVYFGWPIAVMAGLWILFDNIILAVSISTAFFVWPLVKVTIFQKLAVRVFKLMNRTFIGEKYTIRSSSFWFDGFGIIGSPPLRQIRREAAMSKALDVIYNFFNDFGISPKNIGQDWWRTLSSFQIINYLIKRWTDLWIKMPIAADVRSRLQIVAEEVEELAAKIHLADTTRAVRIAVLAGGTGQDIIMAASNLLKRFPDIKLDIVFIEPDGRFGIKRSKELIELFNVPKSFFTYILKKTSVNGKFEDSLAGILQASGYNFDDFDLTVCVGLGDYMFSRIVEFIRMLDNGNYLITANISDNFIERFFLHIFIQWPEMQYLSVSEYSEKLRSALGDDRKIVMSQTPHRIFNIAVVEP